jgi:hypothetical protein
MKMQANERQRRGLVGFALRAFPLVLLGIALAPAQPRQAYHLLVPREEQWAPWKQVSLLYAGQWGYYLTMQSGNIREHGRLSNWVNNPVNPHFDKDFYDYNLVLHTMTGSLYYGYYRAFGSSRPRSLALSTLSALLFEFTVETGTERPSFQDIYQTPVLGAVVGMGFEDLSLLCLESRFAPVRGMGYLFNPFALVPGSAWQVKLQPQIAQETVGGHLVVSFR